MENNLKASGCEYLSRELIHFSILVSGRGVFTLPAPPLHVSNHQLTADTASVWTRVCMKYRLRPLSSLAQQAGLIWSTREQTA